MLIREYFFLLSSEGWIPIRFFQMPRSGSGEKSFGYLPLIQGVNPLNCSFCARVCLGTLELLFTRNRPKNFLAELMSDPSLLHLLCVRVNQALRELSDLT